MQTSDCPFCGMPLDGVRAQFDPEPIHACPRCGHYRAGRAVVDDGPAIVDSTRKKAVMSFALRQKHEGGEAQIVTRALLARLIDNDSPSPAT